MEADYYQQKAMALRNLDLSRDEYVLNAALGLAGEAGEVADMVKKWAYQGHELDEDKLREELGDLLWYVALMAHTMDDGLASIMQDNLDKLHARYPGGFSAEKSRDRDMCPQMSPEAKNGPVLGIANTGISFAAPWDGEYALRNLRSFNIFDGSVYVGRFERVDE